MNLPIKECVANHARPGPHRRRHNAFYPAGVVLSGLARCALCSTGSVFIKAQVHHSITVGRRYPSTE